MEIIGYTVFKIINKIIILIIITIIIITIILILDRKKNYEAQLYNFNLPEIFKRRVNSRGEKNPVILRFRGLLETSTVCAHALLSVEERLEDPSFTFPTFQLQVGLAPRLSSARGARGNWNQLFKTSLNVI